ncbi:MAG: response regulator [Hyphomonadaceae bacterium]|nr:response regulator [Hyphomonadaceae bacterium]MBX3511546.1 response regulator [Hyphomonadaceae bacterium]
MTVAKPLIVVAEDDVFSREALALILSDWGAEVVLGADEREIEAGLGGRWAELAWIITDFHLGPESDGVTLAQRLVNRAPQARVLVLSGSFHGRAPAVAKLAGYDVMHKPARADAIVAWLERA